MRTHHLGHLTVLLALALPACDSWSGSDDPAKSGVSQGREPVAPGNDGGSSSKSPDAGGHAAHELDGGRDAGARGDGGLADGGAVDGGAEAPLGDDRAGHVRCAQESCSGNLHCCTTNFENVQSACEASCGRTEATIACDGAEDCATGQVCCHAFGATGMQTQCITLSEGDADAGTKPVSCDSDELAERRVACHNDAECSGVAGRPLCRADAGRRDYLGYCTEDTDLPDTKGHDDKGMVSCGNPDADGNGEACSLSSALCCVSRDHPAVAACTKADICGFSELSVVCDGPEDCKGSMCCFVPKLSSDAGVTPAESTCADDCAKLDPSALTRCHTDKDCAAGHRCESDESSPWWGVCTR